MNKMPSDQKLSLSILQDSYIMRLPNLLKKIFFDIFSLYQNLAFVRKSNGDNLTEIK